MEMQFKVLEKATNWTLRSFKTILKTTSLTCLSSLFLMLFLVKVVLTILKTLKQHFFYDRLA